MTSKDIFDFIVELLKVIISWPVAIVLIVWYFNTELRSFFPKLLDILARRIKRASVAGANFEFGDVAIEALKDTAEEAVQNLQNQPKDLAKFLRNQISKLLPVPAQKLPPPKPLHSKSILWVDDIPEKNTYEANLFRRLGAHIRFCKSTDEAKQLLSPNAFDLVISDMVRVEQGKENVAAGYELLEWLQKSRDNVSLIFYTGSVSRLNRKRAALSFGSADNVQDLHDLVLSAIGVPS